MCWIRLRNFAARERRGSYGRRLNPGPLRASRSRTGACFPDGCSGHGVASVKTTGQS